jgi:hypothetical protein
VLCFVQGCFSWKYPPPLPRRRSISQCYLGEKYEKGEEKKEENVRKKGKRKKKKGKLKLKG